LPLTRPSCHRPDAPLAIPGSEGPRGAGYGMSAVFPKQLLSPMHWPGPMVPLFR
jgi:hypothetical protein